VFGNAITNRGCFFHLTQSTWREVQALGLATTYPSDEHFKHFCGMLDNLLFLPTDQVKTAMISLPV